MLRVNLIFSVSLYFKFSSDLPLKIKVNWSHMRTYGMICSIIAEIPRLKYMSKHWYAIVSIAPMIKLRIRGRCKYLREFSTLHDTFKCEGRVVLFLSFDQGYFYPWGFCYLARFLTRQHYVHHICLNDIYLVKLKRWCRHQEEPTSTGMMPAELTPMMSPPSPEPPPPPPYVLLPPPPKKPADVPHLCRHAKQRFGRLCWYKISLWST